MPVLAANVIGYPANFATDLGSTIATGINTEKLAIAYSSTGNIASATVGTYPITGQVSDGTALLSDYIPTLKNGALTVTLPPRSAYILDPTASGAVNASGNPTVQLPGGLYVDSNSASAIVASGNALVNVGGPVLVVGGVSKSGNAQVTKTGTPPATNDPLASMPMPSVAGLTNYGAVNVAGTTSTTLSPGIYSSIQISGQASVTLNPGVYIIKGGGLSVSGQGNLTGIGVLIFNAGSSYNGTTDGGSFGSISLSGNGTINLSAAGSGPFAGVLIFQSRSNTRSLSLSGNGAGIVGTLYAPAAAVGLSGNGQITTSLVVSTLSITGNAGAFQQTGKASSDYVASTSNWISNTVLTVAAQDDTGKGLDPSELNQISAAMAYLNQALGSFGVNLSWVAPGAHADVHIHFASSTPQGGASDGVLGFTTVSNDVYIVAGWQYYTGDDASQIKPSQYDFLTLATHELAHTVGLGESSDPGSVMHQYLFTGTARRIFTDSDLQQINTDAVRNTDVSDGDHALTGPTAPVSSPILHSQDRSLVLDSGSKNFSAQLTFGTPSGPQHAGNVQVVAAGQFILNSGSHGLFLVQSAGLDPARDDVFVGGVDGDALIGASSRDFLVGGSSHSEALGIKANSARDDSALDGVWEKLTLESPWADQLRFSVFGNGATQDRPIDPAALDVAFAEELDVR
jgi:Matrixin